MKRQDSKELEARKNRLEERLSRGSWPEKAGPVLAGGNEELSMSSRVRATDVGGIVLVHRLVRQLGLAELIDENVELFEVRRPYHESDHVLTLAYSIVCGGRALDDIEHLRKDEAYLDALGAARIPDPTTAGDFLRRFQRGDIDDLHEAIHVARQRVWRKNENAFFERATIDVDGTIAGTQGECKEGMDMSYKGTWGYAPLLVTLANTGEILYTRNRPGNRPSHEGCFDYLDPAVELAREAGFRSVLLRGDSHFALTDDFDHWSTEGVQFVFGLAAHEKLVGIAEGLETGEWSPMQRDSRRERRSRRRRARKRRVKDEIIRERGYRNLELEEESYAEFSYRPVKCQHTCRVAVLRKTIRVQQGETLLFPETRYHFYITNAPEQEMSAREVIRHANERCNQENLIEQAKNGFHALRMPCDTMLANDAYMAIAALSWNLKAWVAQLWHDRDEGAMIQRMEFRRFIESIVRIPCQVVLSGRRIVHRFLAFSGWLGSVFKAHARLRRLVLR